MGRPASADDVDACLPPLDLAVPVDADAWQAPSSSDSNEVDCRVIFRRDDHVGNGANKLLQLQDQSS